MYLMPQLCHYYKIMSVCGYVCVWEVSRSHLTVSQTLPQLNWSYRKMHALVLSVGPDWVVVSRPWCSIQIHYHSGVYVQIFMQVCCPNKAILEHELANHIHQTAQFCEMWMFNLDSQPQIYGTGVGVFKETSIIAQFGAKQNRPLTRLFFFLRMWKIVWDWD